MRYAQKLAALAICFAAAGTAWGQLKKPQTAPLLYYPADTHTCVTSGSGPTYMKACISSHGNVVWFESPSGKVHTYPDYSMEGYVACTDDGAGGWSWYADIGWDQYFWDAWAEPHKIEQPNGSNTFPLRIYRRSGDGKLELKQEFNRDTTERELTIAMTLYNRSAELIKNVVLNRQADLDTDNDAWDDDICTTSRSVVVWEGWDYYSESYPIGNAVAMTTLTTGYMAGATGRGYWELGTCFEPPFSVGRPDWSDDWMGVLAYKFGDLPAGASRTVKLVYRAF